MRIVHAIAFAAVAGLSAVASTAAFAEGSIPPAHSKAAVTADGSSRLSPGEAQHMRGTYLLDDGRVVVVRNEGSRLFAELDGKRAPLVRTADRRFAARDIGVELEFNYVPYADEVVLRTVAR